MKNLESPVEPLRFWDGIMAVSQGLNCLRETQLAGYITYNALDFLMRQNIDYGEELKEFAIRLGGFVDQAQKAISLQSIKQRLWEPRLTGEEAAMRCGELWTFEEYADAVLELLEEDLESPPGQGTPASLDGILSTVDTLSIRLDLRREISLLSFGESKMQRLLESKKVKDYWARNRQETMAYFEAQVAIWGSCALIQYVEEVGINQYSAAFTHYVISKLERIHADNQRMGKPAGSEETQALDAGEPIVTFSRSIQFSEQGFSSHWLADSSQAILGGKTVPFEEGDRILFSIEKMLQDPRCSAGLIHDTLAAGQAKEPALPNKVSEAGEVDVQALEDTAENMFRIDGEMCHIRFKGQSLQPLRISNGLWYICQLLRSPRKAIPAMTLISTVQNLGVLPGTEKKLPRVTHGNGEESLYGFHVMDKSGNADKLIDARAKSEYEARLRQLAGWMKQAMDEEKGQEVDRLRREIETLQAEHDKSVTKTGRLRRGKSDADRARLRVYHAIVDAYRVIARHCPDLEAYFRYHLKSISGSHPIYDPDPSDPRVWKF